MNTPTKDFPSARSSQILGTAASIIRSGRLRSGFLSQFRSKRGEVVKMPSLANTCGRCRDQPKTKGDQSPNFTVHDLFYKGDIAGLADFMDTNGLFTATIWPSSMLKRMSRAWNVSRLYDQAPSGRGGDDRALNILEGFGPKRWATTARYLHT
jgi:hypothetical protein